MTKIKAKYISDVRNSDLKKGEIYEDLFRPIDDLKKRFVAYRDKFGEEYALPASYFEIISEDEVI